MNNFKINLSIEPTNDYDKAKIDFLQAMNSIQKLSPQQREQLAVEIFGIEKIEFIKQLLILIYTRKTKNTVISLLLWC